RSPHTRKVPGSKPGGNSRLSLLSFRPGRRIILGRRAQPIHNEIPTSPGSYEDWSFCSDNYTKKGSGDESTVDTVRARNMLLSAWSRQV
ncbi:hypothetical protein LEMLEM_LOCUS24396, partial [Lemmus lemmus]